MRYLVIANPVSGRGRSRRLIPRVEAALRAHNLDFVLVHTERPWHAAELAETGARQGYEAIVAAGGDGTVHEVLNGIMGAERARRPALGIIGIGQGNDLALSLGLPCGVEAACDVLAAGRRRAMDVGYLRGCGTPRERYFGNCVGVGFDAAGGIQAEKITWASGWLAYLIAALQTIFIYYKAPLVEISLDEETLRLPTLLVSVMNGRRIGGMFWTGPRAILDDGLFDLCIARQVSRARMFSLLLHFVRGTQDTQPEIQNGRARRVRVRALEGLLPVHADGEILCADGHALEIEIVPHAVEVIAV